MITKLIVTFPPFNATKGVATGRTDGATVEWNIISLLKHLTRQNTYLEHRH